MAAGKTLPGQYFDAETGLHYNYFRDYDPATGRYPQADPLGTTAGTNLYAYAFNNPLAFIDPDGLCPAVIDTGVFTGAMTQDKNFVDGRPCFELTQDRGRFLGTLIGSEGSCDCPDAGGVTCIYDLTFETSNRRKPCSGPWSDWKEFPSRDIGRLRAPLDCKSGELDLSGLRLE